MTRLIVSTNRREATLHEPSGWLFVVDLEEQKILQKTSGLEPPYRTHDDNPRGGMRGMRGLSFFNGELAAADYSAVFFFDKQWNLVRTITHPSVSAIHELLYVENGLWVTSTANDMLARFDLEGNLAEIHCLREQVELMRRVNGPQKLLLRSQEIQLGEYDFRKRSYLVADKYDRLHLNGLAQTPDGRIFVSFGLIVGDMFGALMQIKHFLRLVNAWGLVLSVNRAIRHLLGLKKKMLSELVVQPGQGGSAIVSLNRAGEWDVHLQFPVAHNPSHSVRILEDGTGLYLNSSRGTLIHFTMSGDILLEEKISDEFLRGLLVLPNGQLALGAGSALLIYDLKAREVVSNIQLTDDPRNSVFDIQILPPDFELPPVSLHEKIGRVIGFEGRRIIWEGTAGAHSRSHS